MATINLGNIRFNWRGEYNENTNYIKDDVVKHKGSSYVATQASTGIALENESYWDKMVDLSEKIDTNNGVAKGLTCDLKGTSSLRFTDIDGKRAVFFRFDGNVLYILRTKEGDQKGGWDDARPFAYDVNHNELVFNSEMYKNGKLIPNIGEIFKLGDFKLFPFPPNELPAGWYLRNGDRHPSGSNIGKALKSLSAEYRRLWNIVEIDGYINLPNAFNSNGDGYFERPVNGISRQVGSIQGDSIRNITGHVHTDSGWMFSDASGAFYLSGNEREKLKASVASGSRNTSGWFDVDASRVVPTAHENRPINISMTPAIYLGV